MSVRSRSNWNLEVLVFKERGKPEYPEKNLSEQRREPTTNSIHIWHQRQDLNPGHIGGKPVFSLRHSGSPLISVLFKLYPISFALWSRDFEQVKGQFFIKGVLRKAKK